MGIVSLYGLKKGTKGGESFVIVYGLSSWCTCMRFEKLTLLLRRGFTEKIIGRSGREYGRFFKHHTRWCGGGKGANNEKDFAVS